MQLKSGSATGCPILGQLFFFFTKGKWKHIFNKLTSVLCVCPLIDDKLRHNFVKVCLVSTSRKRRKEEYKKNMKNIPTAKLTFIPVKTVHKIIR